MANIDFIINNGVLEKYIGPGGNVVIPNSVVKIGKCAFENSSVKKISFSGNSLRSIEAYAFCGCKELLNIQIPDGVIQIGDHAFANCEQLHYISLPKSLIDVGAEILVGCHSDLFVIGSEGSEAEAIAKAHYKPLRTDGARAIKAYELLQAARENSEVRNFDIFGEEVSCDGQLKKYDEIISYYRNQKDSFFNAVHKQMPTSIQNGYNGSPEKVFEGANQTLYSRMEKLGLIVNHNDIAHYILTPYATFVEIVKSIVEVYKTLVNAVNNNIEINNQTLIDNAESKVTGLNYGVIGDSFDMLFYSIDDYREKQRQRKAAYAEAQQQATWYNNAQTRKGDTMFADFLAKVQPHLRQVCDNYLEGLRQAEVALLLENGILTSNPEEDYDIKKSVQIMQQVAERGGDNRFSIALALKKYPCNVAALIYAVEHGYTCPDLIEMMDFLKLSGQVYGEVKRRKEQKKQAIRNEISKKVGNAAVDAIRSNERLFEKTEICEMLYDVSGKIAKSLRSVFYVEKSVDTPNPEAYVRRVIDSNLSEDSWKFFGRYGVSPIHSSSGIPKECTASWEIFLFRMIDAFKKGNNKCRADEEAALFEKRLQEQIRLQKEAERKKKNKRIVLISSLAAIVIISFIVVLNTVIIPNGKYNDAIALMDAGNIVEAYEALVALEGYKDSTDKANSIYDKYKVKKLKVAKVGDYVFFGAYEQDNNTSNGKEDVEWLVLEVKDGKALVISKYALDCKQYNTSYTDVTWETCTLRKWLNNDFLGAAFSADEKSMIPAVTVSADKNPEYSTNPGNATHDQVFLLSITEANKYFNSDSARQCEPTDYAVANGAYVKSNNGNCFWWLRSPGDYQFRAARVSTGGDVIEYGNYVNYGDRAVRPAMWIELSNLG